VAGDGCTWGYSATVTCTVSEVSIGVPAHLTLTVTTDGSYDGLLHNTAGVEPAGEKTVDPNPNNNNAELAVYVRGKRRIYLPLVFRNR